MKLVIGIINSDDANDLLAEITKASFQATKLSTSGGFLKMGNVTVLVGVEDEQVEMNFDDLDSVTTFVQLEEDPDNHITLMDFEDEEPHGDFEIFTLFDDDIQ